MVHWCGQRWTYVATLLHFRGHHVAMGAKNGQSVFDLVTEFWRRKVSVLNGETLCVSIPSEYRDEQGIEKGDDVAIKPADDHEGVLELHFE